MLLRFIGAFLALGFAQAALLQSSLKRTGIKALYPGDAEYPEAGKVYNSRYPHQPAAITYPANAQEVAAIVQLAKMEGVHVVARSGGHSYIGNSLGGRKSGDVVIDLKNLSGIEVDPETGIAIVGPGNKLGTVALKLNEAGRALPHGTCPDVGLGGHASYGGSGYTNRMWGITLDRIKSMEVVLANGTIVTASKQENPDLFWAMRGAGGSYGITTTFTFETFPAPPTVTYFTYKWDLPTEEAIESIQAYQSFVLSDIPSHLGMNLVIAPGRALGRVRVFIMGGWHAEYNGLYEVMKPLLDAFPVSYDIELKTGTWIHTLYLMGKFTGSHSLTDTKLPSVPFYVKSLMAPEGSPLTRGAIEALVNFFGEDAFAFPLPSSCILELYGGPNSAVNAVDLDDSAFAHRDTLYTFECNALDEEPQLPSEDVAYEYLDRLYNNIISNSPKGWNYGAYPNYLDDRLQNWQQLYYGKHYPKLQQLKQKYDPENMFSFPLGIELPPKAKILPSVWNFLWNQDPNRDAKTGSHETS